MESIKAVVSIRAPTDPAHVTNLFSESVEDITANGESEVNIGGRPFKIKNQFIQDLRDKEISSIVKSLRKPLLVLHSPQDKTVEIKNAANIYGWAHHPKSFVSIVGADHLLTDKKDALYVGAVIGSWSERYLPRKASIDIRTKAQILARSTDKKFTTEIQAKGFSFIADEPIDYGGNALGPYPYSFIASGLAACNSMTIKMYADRKGWNLENIEVEVNHGKDYVQDCENCESSTNKIDKFERVISLSGNLTEKEKERLL